MIVDPLRGHEYPHDLTHVIGRTVQCFLCDKAVPLSEAWSAGSEIAMSLYMHELCYYRVGPERCAKIFHKQLKGVLVG